MDIETFCVKLHVLNLTQARQAVAILWFFDKQTSGVKMTPGELAKHIKVNGLGNPHSTQLADAIKKTKCVLYHTSGFQIKPTARVEIEGWLASILGPQLPPINQGGGFLPEEVWKNTRGYIEKVCIQINGCFQYCFYDGAAVLIRRVAETLLIECYEHLRRQKDIQDTNGNYLMLNGIISHAVGANGLALGRDTKKALGEIKALGDKSAHNRRYTTVLADLDRIQSEVRLAVDELIQLANLKKMP